LRTEAGRVINADYAGRRAAGVNALCLQLYRKNQPQLDDKHMAEVYRRAFRTCSIESAVPETPEARDVAIDRRHLDAAVAEVASCFCVTRD